MPPVPRSASNVVPKKSAPQRKTPPQAQQKLASSQSYQWYSDPSAPKRRGSQARPKQPVPVLAEIPVPDMVKPKARPVPHRSPPAHRQRPHQRLKQHVQTKPMHRPSPQRTVNHPVRRPVVPHHRPNPRAAPSVNALRSVDFRRQSNGGGRIIVILPKPNVKVTNSKRGNALHLLLEGVDVPPLWQKRLDVVDFATPVASIYIAQRQGNGRIVVNGSRGFTYRTEQERNIYTVYIDPIKKKPAKLKPGEKKKKEFKGEKLSLNFQDIEVRAVLQLLADFTDKNIVVSDSVNGNITVRLKDVPWDQALDIVLESKNLGMRENGSVIWVAPTTELEAKEERELELAKRKMELEPLVTEYISINFAKASELASLIQARSGSDEATGRSLLSKRGTISFDERTNTLLVQDTQEQVDEIKELIKRLDVPVQQVLIEARIVVASDDFNKQLGARFGASSRWATRDSSGITGGSINGADDYYTSVANANNSSNLSNQLQIPGLNDRLITNLPVAGAAGGFGISVLTSDFLLDLELSALQSESQGEVIATPRILASNQTTARIQQGVEIPFQEATSSGATNTAFKKAVLSLEVTPQITPDEQISMNLKVHQDTVGELFGGVPSVDTRQLETTVLVANGQTIVLGGIQQERSTNGATKVPVLGDLPVVGKLFRNTQNEDEKRELLIFVKPTIADGKAGPKPSR